MALAATGETRARQVTQTIDDLLAAQKRARDEKKRLANEVKNARRRRARLTKRARLLTTEDLLTVVALRERERAARGHTSEADGVPDELVASERPDNEEEPDNAAEANRDASPELQGAQRDEGTSN